MAGFIIAFTHPFLAALLLIAGSVLFVWQLYDARWSWKGTGSLACFLLFFSSHLAAGLTSVGAIILFGIGLILLVIELFVPGGVIGVAGVSTLVWSLFLAAKHSPFITVSLSIAVVSALMMGLWLSRVSKKKMALFEKIVLTDEQRNEKGYVSHEARIDLMGKRGVSLTVLRPSGTALIDRERVDVVTEGEYIERNRPIEVIHVDGLKIVVRECKKEEEIV
ncbi:membrane-bound ClpP family serine protease [Anoxybacillus mongoliensis]|uniref:Membrane-bound ClpP family serine protease n=1 Tax=Anoxybacillus mongoliensis TaxID=452565 RepID=A0A7W8JCJ9_9BACL|nr:NfeD family protein [Anoxybacillus mongoliensis]MBB5354531.1 membrane-bound ClpP family serine protease [Anoxybacillus mongoliensis]